jgi:hypothetical protein
MTMKNTIIIAAAIILAGLINTTHFTSIITPEPVPVSQEVITARALKAISEECTEERSDVEYEAKVNSPSDPRLPKESIYLVLNAMIKTPECRMGYDPRSGLVR